MHRWTLALVVVLQAVVLIALNGPVEAMAASSSTAQARSTSFKGKVSVYYRDPAPYSGHYSPYFVVNFTCSPSASPPLSGNWTWDTSSGASYGGPLSASACSLTNIPLSPRGSNITTATLTLTLMNVTDGKTYVSNTTNYTSQPMNSGCVGNPKPVPCIGIKSMGLGAAVAPQSSDGDFYSNPGNPDPAGTPTGFPDATAPYGTLTLSGGLP